MCRKSSLPAPISTKLQLSLAPSYSAQLHAGRPLTLARLLLRSSTEIYTLTLCVRPTYYTVHTQMKGLCCCSSAALVHRELLAYYLSRGWGFGGELYRSIVYILSLLSLSLSLSLCRLCTRTTPFSVCVSELRLDNTFFSNHEL
jgi:hypothetical protein